MVQKVEIVIDGKSVELPVLEASEGLNVIDVRGIIKEGLFTFITWQINMARSR